MSDFILVIDEGTTGVRGLLFNKDMQIVNQVYRKLTIYYPGPDEVESDAMEIYEKTLEVCREVLKAQNISAKDVASIGITTQRTSFVLWDKTTGTPLRNAILWLDARGRHQKQKFIDNSQFNKMFPGLAERLPGVFTPLIIDKLRDDEEGFTAKFHSGNTLFGSIDTWLIWKLTGGKVHATSSSTASASTIYLNEHQMWHPILKAFSIPESILPEIREESDNYGTVTADIFGAEIPICSAIADQQSALFSQGCLSPNSVKCTMGTGTFIDINVGETFRDVPTMTNMISWKLGGKASYMLEGMGATAGASLEWARNEFKLFDDFSVMEELAGSVDDSDGVYFIPALAGLTCAPYKDESARGAYMGLSPRTRKAHFMRATLEGIAFMAVLLMEEAIKIGIEIKEIKISGGVARSNTVAQTIADTVGARVIRPKSVEATALGAAETAAIQMGWMTEADVEKYLNIDREFEPGDNREKMSQSYENWKKVIERTLNWEF